LQNILNLLCDGRCHSLVELRTEADLSERQIKAAVAFLIDYGFAEMNKGIQVRISRAAEKLITQTFEI
jgi:hypothetical protein